MREFNKIDFRQVQNLDEIDGVLYKEIKEFLSSKEELENILFGTKIVFVENSELVEFINKLIEFNYKDVALDYMENVYNKIAIDFSDLRNYENKTK